MPSQPAANRPMTPIEWGMLLMLSAVWGGSFFFNEIALRALPVLSVVATRVGLGALILIAFLALRGQRLPRGRGVWGAFLAMGLLNNAVPFSLIVAGQQQLASGVASILNAATPLFTVLLAHLLTADEKMSTGKLAGVLIGFAGVAVMIGGSALGGAGGTVLAQALCLAAALSYAFAGLFGRRFRAMGLTPTTAAAGQLAGASVILVPLAGLLEQPWQLPMPGWPEIWALLGLAALSSALAYVLYFRILASAGATNLLLVTFLVPVSAILLGVLFLGEVLLPRHLAGMLLITLGLAAIDGRAWRWRRYGRDRPGA